MEPNHTGFSDEYFYLIHAAGEACTDNGGTRLKELLRANPGSVNVTGYKGRTPLMAACGAWGWEAGDWDPFDPFASELLIDSGANVNAVDEDGYSALCYALTYGTDHIDNMLKAGANLDQALEVIKSKCIQHLMDVHDTLLEYADEDEDGQAAVYRDIAKYIGIWAVRNNFFRYG